MKKTMKVMAAIMLTMTVICAAGCKKDIAKGDGTFYGHNYVDLGLPSGTLWATCNVGATTPEEYGDYFAWGETTPKDYYAWSTHKYSNGDYTLLTKYCFDSSYGYNGFTDNLTTLLPEDDAATANWGGGWRTPTKIQWEELLYYTTSTWKTQNGVYGRLFTAANGRCLFLPAAGIRFEDRLDSAGHFGFYSSSSLDRGKSYMAGIYYFGQSKYDDYVSSNSRIMGQSVRAVHEN